MDDRIYHIRISPENILHDIFQVVYTGGTIIPNVSGDPCCDVTTTTTTGRVTGYTTVYSSMTQVLSGGTEGTSLLTGLTVPIFLQQNTVDFGYYSVFDGFATQQDTMTNFLFSATTGSPYTYNFYNTSEVEYKKYLSFSNYQIDWGDSTPIQTVTTLSPNFYSHTYSSPGEFTITMSGMSPWGYNVVKKKVYTPFTGVTIPNPYGTAYFTPQGGSWSGTLLSYNYIFTGDAICDIYLQSSFNYTTVPFLVTGYTKSSIDDLSVYGKKTSLYAGKYKLGVQVTGTSNSIGTFWGPDPTNTYTGYTINDIDYYDYNDGTTIFVVQSSGFTPDWLVCSAITKNEAFLNIIDEPQVQSNVFIDRGKNSGLESVQRLNEVDNIGDIEKYGYKFFNIIKY
jgi:hypothetical protein